MQLISKIKDDVADVVHVQATSDSGETVKKNSSYEKIH